MKKHLLSLSGLFVALLLVGAGCTVTTNDGTDSSDVTTDTAVEETTDDTADGEVMEKTSLWTTATDQGQIPSTDIAGTINDEAVTVAHVQVDFDGEEYDWTFSDTDNTSTCSFKTGDSEVNFRSIDLQEGTFVKGVDDDVEFDDYHSYYVYPQESGSPFSVNTDWGATVVVTGIERGLEEGTFGESIGTVTGFADIEFSDGKTALSGAFEAELCEK